MAREWARDHSDDLNPLGGEFLMASVDQQDRETAEERLRQKREIEMLQHLAEEAEARRQAETDRTREAEARARDQAAASAGIRRLDRFLIGAGLLALDLACVTWLQTYRANRADRKARKQTYDERIVLAEGAYLRKDASRVLDFLEVQRPSPREEDIRDSRWREF